MKVIKDKDKNVFIKTLNKKGFLLEDKTWKMINDFMGIDGIRKNEIFDHYDGRPVEIDLIFKKGNKIFIIECKRTEYSWFFPKAKELKNSINLIFSTENGFEKKRRNIRNIDDLPSVWNNAAILLGDGNSIVRNTGNKNLAQTSYKDVRDNVKQVLRETEGFISNEDIEENKIIIPVIVTNTDLYLMNYSKSNLNSRGDISSIEDSDLKEIYQACYNIPETMYYKSNSEIDKIDDKTRSSDEVKSVFITNVNNLKKLIDTLLDQDL